MELDDKPLYSVTIQMKTPEPIQLNGAHVSTRTPASPSCLTFPGLPRRHAGPAMAKGKGKGKVHPKNRPRRPKGGVEVLLYSFLNLGARWGGWSTPHPAALPPGKIPSTHCIGGWGDPRAGLDGCGKSPPPPPRFDPRTVQPIASRYTE
jgi:hypothetical protein